MFELLATLPADKLAEVYDFARFIAEQRAAQIIVDERSEEKVLMNASIESLRRIWDSPEEDEAWDYLRQAK